MGILAHGGGGANVKKLIALVFLPLVAYANPETTLQYLVNERATLLDVGLVRLDDLTDEFENRVGLHWMEGEQMKWFKAEINSYYESKEAKIVVSFLVMSNEPSQTQMEEGCANAMSQMRIWLLKSLPGMFLHEGFEDPSKPDDFYSGIRDLFEIRCYFSSSTDTSQGRFWASHKLSDAGPFEMTIERHSTEPDQQ